MTQRFVIELDHEPAGIVVAERAGYRFYAASSTFVGLNQRLFRSPGHAEQACRDQWRTAMDTVVQAPWNGSHRIGANRRRAP
jgi:hypothetical protein